MLSNMLQNSKGEAWEEYKKLLPEEALTKQTHWRLAVVIVAVETSASNEIEIVKT